MHMMHDEDENFAFYSNISIIDLNVREIQGWWKKKRFHDAGDTFAKYGLIMGRFKLIRN